MTNWSVLRSCGMIVATALVATLPAGAWAQEHGNSAPPPVDTQTNPDAVLLNARNPLAAHAGPGHPNHRSRYIPPTLSGKDKGTNANAGQTESKDMGAAP